MAELVGFRLSPQQQRRWRDENARARLAYCEAVITGCSIAIADVEAGLRRVVARHESLRTAFQSAPGMRFPLQVIAETPALEVHVVQPGDELAGAASLVAALALPPEPPLDLARPPLVRAWLRAEDGSGEGGGGRVRLLIGAPALVADPDSLAIVLAELAAILGDPGWSPDEPTQYADYAEWANERVAAGDGAAVAARALWAAYGQVAEAPPPWPARAASREDSAGAATGADTDTDTVQGRALPPATCAALRAFCAQHEVAPRGVLLAVWSAVLARSFGAERVRVDCALPREPEDALTGCVGPFTRLAPYGPAAPDAQPLLPAARAAEALLVQAAAAQSYIGSADGSAEEAAACRFTWRQAPARLVTGAVSLRVERLDTTDADCDVELVAIAGPEHLDVEVRSPAARVDAATIARLCERVDTLLASALARPDQPLREHALVGREERRDLVERWNRTRGPVSPRPLLAAFADQVARTPERNAVVCGADALRFAELDARASRLAAALAARGVTRGQLVGLYLERSVSLVVGVLGVWKAGAAFLPVDRHQPRERLHRILDDARPACIVASEPLAGHLDPAWRDSLILMDPRGAIPDAPSGAGGGAAGDAASVSGSPPADSDPPAAGDLAYLMYTSGSTGTPKGVLIEHGAVANLRAALDEAIYMPVFGAPASGSPGARQLHVSMNAPLSFDASIKQLVAIFGGHCLHVLDDDMRRDGDSMLAHLEQHPLDVLDCTPSQLKLLQWAGFFERPHAAPAAVLVGGEAIDDALWERLAAAGATRFFNVYGPTECTVDTTIGEITPDAPQPHIGRPIANARVYLLDAARQLAPVGAVGELYIAGAGLARGYHGDPQLTAERFLDWSLPSDDDAPVRERVYRSGDLARFLPDGRLVFAGRTDRQVKVRGYRLELGEIEAALRLHPAVTDAAVIARALDAGITQLVGYASVRPPAGGKDAQDGQDTREGDDGQDDRAAGAAPLDTDALRAHAARRAHAALRAHAARHLPDYMIPSKLVIVPAMPLTDNGKVDVRALERLEQRYTAQRASYVAPRSELERAIAAIWTSVLDVASVGIEDNFFDLGGHSLLLPVVQSALEKQLDLRLPIARLLEYPTIRRLVSYVSARDERDPTRAGELVGARRRAARARRSRDPR